MCVVAAIGVLSCNANAAEAWNTSGELWRRIDFDADLTGYLINLKQVERKGDEAWAWELHAPARTAISVGLENHLIIKRHFNCIIKSERLDDLYLFRDLQAKGIKLAHADTEFKVSSGSIDEASMKFACDGVEPTPGVEYGSRAEAVQRSFADAVKLPSAQSNRTMRGFGGGRPPAGPGGEPLGPASTVPRPSGTPEL